MNQQIVSDKIFLDLNHVSMHHGRGFRLHSAAASFGDICILDFAFVVAKKNSAYQLQRIGHLAVIRDVCIAVEHMAEAYATRARLYPTYTGRICCF